MLNGVDLYNDVPSMNGMYSVATADDIHNTEIFNELPSNISETLIDFIEKAMQLDPKQRYSATQLLSHPFIKQYDDESTKVKLQELFQRS